LIGKIPRVNSLKKRLILIVFIALLVGAGVMVYIGQRQERNNERYYSGTIEATQADLAFQVQGRVQSVLIDEGQAVVKDQVLAELNPNEFLARRDQAQANLVLAQEKLKELESTLTLYRESLPAAVERAAASVKSLAAQRDELTAGYRSQEVEQARLSYESAKISMEEALKDKDRYEKLFQKRVVSAKDKESVDVRYETALKNFQRAQEAYLMLKKGFRQESIESAQARLAEGRAVLKQAKSNLKKIEATAKQVAAARAQVKAADAELVLAKIQLAHTRLQAPFNGILSSRNVEPGEVVSPGREVFSISDLSVVDLKIFVEETEIGDVKPGQKADVKIDTFPDKTYHGRVSYISPEGEFTPKIIQTRKERVKLVYLVKVTLPNPDFELKSGMPADAWLR
jgi:HlyD family secretion protein